jgi:lysine-N-methylase
MAISLTLPTIQNWSCHNCGGCCRQHAIEVTEEERQRILSQGWTAQDGTPSGNALFERLGGTLWTKRYQLAHQADGACVFLNEHGLCRIHAKFGEAAKPLACRIYPYAFHPAGKKVTVSLRFSCPSVVANRGRTMSQNSDEIKQLAKAVVPEGHERTPPPALAARERLDWSDLLRLIDAIDATLTTKDAPISVKLQRTLFWLNLVEQSRFDKLSGARLTEFLDIIRQAAADEISPHAESPPPTTDSPTPLGRVQFRLLTAQYARKDTAADLSSGWRGRWKLFRAATQFARGAGNVPPLQSVFREVPFEALEQPFGFPAESEELWTRYFRVKVAGLHFCGPAYYDVPLVEGFQSLALIFPTTLWIARWLAASQSRTQLTHEDISRALSISDHHHGYSPIFGSFGFRRRVRTLSQMGEIPKLIGWYSR